MVSIITHIGRFLVITDDYYDGSDVTTYINVDNIVSIEFGVNIVSILCLDDTEYKYIVNPAQLVMIKGELHKIS